MTDTPSIPLARLSAIVFRTMMDDLHARLRERGWRDVGSSFGFVLLEARRGPLGITEIARLLGVTKQAASKLVATMAHAGYLKPARADDGRAHRVAISSRGQRLLRAVEEIYRDLEAEWADVIGGERVEAVRRDLTRVLVTRYGAIPSVRPVSSRPPRAR